MTHTDKLALAGFMIKAAHTEERLNPNLTSLGMLGGAVGGGLLAHRFGRPLLMEALMKGKTTMPDIAQALGASRQQAYGAAHAALDVKDRLLTDAAAAAPGVIGGGVLGGMLGHSVSPREQTEGPGMVEQLRQWLSSRV